MNDLERRLMFRLATWTWMFVSSSWCLPLNAQENLGKHKKGEHLLAISAHCHHVVKGIKLVVMKLNVQYFVHNCLQLVSWCFFTIHPRSQPNKRHHLTGILPLSWNILKKKPQTQRIKWIIAAFNLAPLVSWHHSWCLTVTLSLLRHMICVLWKSF